MKLTRIKKFLVLALALANGFFAAAQTNGVPDATDFSAFSKFITARNIFDPSRYAHSGGTRPAYRPKVSRSTPTFTLVGTMHYEKGMFAFFDGNNSDLRKVLYASASDTIAGYTVTEITLAGATLQTADKKQTVHLKIGDSMRQSGSEWQLAAADDSTASAATESSSADAAAPSSSASAPNDVLKKLMEQRAKELK